MYDGCFSRGEVRARIYENRVLLGRVDSKKIGKITWQTIIRDGKGQFIKRDYWAHYRDFSELQPMWSCMSEMVEMPVQHMLFAKGLVSVLEST